MSKRHLIQQAEAAVKGKCLQNRKPYRDSKGNLRQRVACNPMCPGPVRGCTLTPRSMGEGVLVSRIKERESLSKAVLVNHPKKRKS